jgi:23S rRNA A2030 N6-methylase RlmJ
LGSDDPAVRLYAIVALEKITGERRGYSPYDPPYEREQAIERWVAALKDGPGAESAGTDDPRIEEVSP